MAKSVVGTPSNLELVLEHITLAEVLILSIYVTTWCPHRNKSEIGI